MTMRRWVPVLAAASLLAGVPARADKLSKQDKQWLDQVRPIMLPEEEKTFRGIEDKSDRNEFQKIFWARRDPNLDTPANEFRDDYEAQRKTLDERFAMGGRPGSATDCGRVFVLVGEPDETTKGDGARHVWTYKQGGKTKIQADTTIEFEPNCMLPQGSRLGEQLARLAEDRILHPNLRYQPNAEGRLTKLEDQLPKPTPAQELLKTPRQDFPAAIDTNMFLRSPGGATYMAGLYRGDAAAGLTTQDVGGKKTARVQVVMQAVDEAGVVTTAPDRESLVEYKDDGTFVVSYGMALRPGKYNLRVGALDPKSKKASLVEKAVEVPALSGSEVTTSEMMALYQIVEGQAGPEDPYAAFTLGTTQFLPRFGNTFKPTDQLTLLAAIYNAQVDATTGKPSVTATFKILKDGKGIAAAEPQKFETEAATPSVGPVPLEKFNGTYTAELVVKDEVAQKEVKRDLTFVVQP